MRNAKKYSSGKRSKFKGVRRVKDGRFRASIMMQYRRINLGTFVDAESAAGCYDENARAVRRICPL